MADTQISVLTELASGLAATDEFVVVDKSDTTMAATGTTKRITKATLASELGSGHTIADEGSNLTQRPTLNFVGAGVTATDNAGQNRTDVTISGGASGEDTSYTDLGNQTGTTLTVNYNTARTQRLVLANASNLVISFSNWPASGNRGSIELFFVHDNTTNTRTFSFSPTPKYHQGSAPFWPTTTANAISRALVTTIDGGTTIFVDQVGSDYA